MKELNAVEKQKVREYIKYLPAQCLQASASIHGEIINESGLNINTIAKSVIGFAKKLMDTAIEGEFYNWSDEAEIKLRVKN